MDPRQLHKDFDFPFLDIDMTELSDVDNYNGGDDQGECCMCKAHVPLNINMGFTLGSPSANTVSCTVHCCLSNPEAPPQTHTVLSPLVA